MMKKSAWSLKKRQLQFKSKWLISIGHAPLNGRSNRSLRHMSAVDPHCCLCLCLCPQSFPFYTFKQKVFDVSV